MAASTNFLERCSTDPDNSSRSDEVTPPIALPTDWYTYVVVPGVREDVPGIYEWHIEGVGSYIGQYGRIRRPTREYGRNVTRLLNREPYRRGKKDGFRNIHIELEPAHRANLQITLTILENEADRPLRNLRERHLISERGALNSPPYGGATRPEGIV